MPGATAQENRGTAPEAGARPAAGHVPGGLDDPPHPQRPLRSRSGLERVHVFLLPLLLLLLAGAAAWRLAVLQHRSDVERLRESVRAELEPVRGELARELYGALQLTQGIAGLVAVQGGIAPEQFRALAGELMSRSPVLRNVAMAPDNVIADVFPREGNERALGLDYARSPEQWPGVERMMAEGRIVVAGPFELVQGGLAVVGRTPIHAADRSRPGAPRHYWGLISTVIDFPALLAKAVPAEVAGRLRLALRGADGTGASGAVFWGDADLFARDPVPVDVALPSGSWVLAAEPRDGWPVFQPAESGVFLAGGLLAVVLAVLLYKLLQVSDAREIEVDARRRTEVALRQTMQSLERARAELEQRVEERTRELHLAKDFAESADRTKSAFLATMSHELRTPLNSIIGFTGILLQQLAGPLTAEQGKQLGMVQGSARHLLALINDVLDISKIEAGQLALRQEPVDLVECVAGAVAALRPLAEKKGLRLESRVAEPPGRLQGDRRRVEQILLNLLSNAIKFTDQGEVSVAVAREGDRATVAVKDTGIGIRPEELPHLFQPFHQIEAGITRRHEGTGLGLAICRRLLERMGGAIEVQSAPGLGSVFRFTLPAEPP